MKDSKQKEHDLGQVTTINRYQPLLQEFFFAVNKLKLRSFHFSSSLRQSNLNYERLTDHSVKTISGVALVLSDWSGPTDQGWKIVHHSGVVNSITLDNYETEIPKLLSFQCCYTFCQCYERICSLFKDFIIQRSTVSPDILKFKIKGVQYNYTRKTLPNGEALYDLMKKASGKTFRNFSQKNNPNIKYKQFWSMISELRHAITHAESLIDQTKLLGDDSYKKDLFKYLFPKSNFTGVDLEVILDYQDLETLVVSLAEFAFQVFKSLSIEEELEWNYFITKENAEPKQTLVFKQMST